MKIVVCQFYTSNISYGKFSEEINKKYCEDNGVTKCTGENVGELFFDHIPFEKRTTKRTPIDGNNE